jgi:fumarate hydratase class II
LHTSESRSCSPSKTIRQTVIDPGLIGDKLSEEELDKQLDVLAMAKVKDGD